MTTNRDDVAEAVRALTIMRRGHGSLYDISVPGYKANLSDVLASIALCQLDKVERHRAMRLRQVELYDAAVAELDGIEPVARDPRDTHAHHLYVVRVDAERAGATRDEYREALAGENIGTSVHFLPVHRLTAYRERYPDQPPLPGRRARRRGGALAAALARALGARTSRTRSTRSAACTRRFTGVRRRSRPGRRRRSSSPASAPRTSSGRSTSARRSTSCATHSSATSSASVAIMVVTVLPMAWRWQRLLAGARDPRQPRLADARVLHRVHRRAGAADLDRRRRDADLRDDAAASRAAAGRSPARCCSSGRSAAPRRSCWRRSASCSRSAATTSAPTSGSSSASSSRRSCSASSSSRGGCAARCG